MPRTKLASAFNDSPRNPPAAPGGVLSFNIETDPLAKKIADYLLPQVLAALHESLGKKDQDRLLTPDEVAGLFKITRETVFQWRKRGILTAHRRAGRVYFKQSELDDSQGKVSKYHVAKFPKQ